MIPKAEGTFSPFPVVVGTLTSRSADEDNKENEENEKNVDDSEDYCCYKCNISGRKDWSFARQRRTKDPDKLLSATGGPIRTQKAECQQNKMRSFKDNLRERILGVPYF